jgi:hypothetical protein
MNITITIPDAYAAAILDAYCETYGYQATINGQPNPQTKLQFARAHIRSIIADAYQSRAGDSAGSAARLQAKQEIGD